jgi:hypothetical protein
MDYRGRLLVLEEVGAEDIGLITHIRQNLKPVLNSPRYSRLPVSVVGDPSGVRKSEYDEVNAFDIFKREGVPCMPAGTNDIDTRLRAVESYLLQQRDGGPAMVFDRSRCPKLIQGMNGMYRYGKAPLNISKPLPDKNPWSHVADSAAVCRLGHAGPDGAVDRTGAAGQGQGGCRRAGARGRLDLTMKPAVHVLSGHGCGLRPASPGPRPSASMRDGDGWRLKVSWSSG